MYRRLLKLLVFFLFSSAVFCEGDESVSGPYQEGGGWLLSALPFELTSGSSKAAQQAATDIPTLILEKIAGDASHVLSLSEQLDRQLFQLQTDRLSLCLQLSRELKARDGLVLSEHNARKLKKQIAEAEKKIALLEESIRQNLTDAEVLKGRYDSADEGPSVLEAISILDRNAFSLLELPEGEDVNRFALSRGLSGLIHGSIESFGNFVSVTAELLCYPGGWSAGSVTEVGELNELSELADNLVVALIPKIANTMPVEIHFTVSPAEALASCQIFVDGILLKEGAMDATVSYGTHKVEICADGYFTKSVSYRFTESSQYAMVVPMEKMSNGTFDLTFLGTESGAPFANGRQIGFITSSNRNLPVLINGKPVLGRFIAGLDADQMTRMDELAQGPAGSYYYYVSPELQEHGAALGVKLKQRPDEEAIHKRRIWSYRGYSAFMLALPAAILAYGNYLEVKDGYFRGGELRGTLDNAVDFSNAATAVAAVAGGFFLFELFRYVHKASGLLPQEASVLDMSKLNGSRRKGRQKEAEADGSSLDGLLLDGIQLDESDLTADDTR